MVESEAKELSEDVMLGAVMFGHKRIPAGHRRHHQARRSWPPRSRATSSRKTTRTLEAEVLLKIAVGDLRAGLQDHATSCSATRRRRRRQDRTVQAHCCRAEGDEPEYAAEAVDAVFERAASAKIVRWNDPRHQGPHRRPRPRHRAPDRLGSRRAAAHPRLGAVHPRRDPGASSSPRWAPRDDEQCIDALAGEYKETLPAALQLPSLLGRRSAAAWAAPGRREIGHGQPRQARACRRCCRRMEEFPYTIRVVSEITESNGSSSMASVCGSSLALMDAGVPLKAPVAGIAMGLIKEGERLRGPVRHPGRRRSPRRHGLQGGRHRQRHHRAADGHQDRRASPKRS